MFLGRVVGEGEPLWLEDDRAWAMALLEVEADTCSGCGNPLSETTAFIFDAKGRKVPAHTYAASRFVCAACDVIAIKQEGANVSRPRSSLWRARRID